MTNSIAKAPSKSPKVLCKAEDIDVGSLFAIFPEAHKLIAFKIKTIIIGLNPTS